MNSEYQKVIDYIIFSGKRLLTKTKVIDIGITKKYLTQEDLVIERGFAKFIKSLGGNYDVYGEEEHSSAFELENTWIIDPISGTASFIRSLPHYAIVVAHIKDKKVKFAAVYDPTVNELFTAFDKGGAFLNGGQIKVTEGSEEKPVIGFNLSLGWEDKVKVEKIMQKLLDYRMYRNSNSSAVNYCYVACGRYDGIISLNKDAFPEFAGSLIIREAGGKFTNVIGETIIKPDDRVFVGGNKKVYKELKSLVRSVF